MREVNEWLKSLLQSRAQIATAFVAIISLLFSYIKDLDANSRRVKRLQEAKLRIEFWSSWKQSIDLSGSDLNLADREIRRAATAAQQLYDGLISGAWDSRDYLVYYSRLNALRRFILFFKLPTQRLRIIRAGCYAFTAESVVASYLLIARHGHGPRFVQARLWIVLASTISGAAYLLGYGRGAIKALLEAFRQFDQDTSLR